jgi:CHASE1-domain containing sensor protein
MSTHTESSNLLTRYRQYVPAALVAIAGVLVTLGIFLTAYSWERRTIDQEFRSLAEDRFHAIDNMVAATSRLLHFTDNVFQVGPRPDSTEFPRYVGAVKRLLEHDLKGRLELSGLAWTPRVSPGERAAYERAAQAVLDPGFRLRTTNASAEKDQKLQSADCFPSYLCLGQTPLRGKLGENVALDPAIWELMQRACDADSIVAGAPLRLGGKTDGRLGYRIIKPLYTEDDQPDVAARRKNNTGFLCLDLVVSELVDIAFKNVAPVGIQVDWVDVTDKSPIEVYQHMSRLDPSTVCEGGGCRSAELEATWTTDFFGRKLLLRCSSDRAFSGRRNIWEPWILLIGGLALTLLGAAHRFAVAYHNVSVERVVTTRLAAIQHEAEQRRQVEGR